MRADTTPRVSAGPSGAPRLHADLCFLHDYSSRLHENSVRISPQGTKSVQSHPRQLLSFLHDRLARCFDCPACAECAIASLMR